jgi:hypothetical protein
LANYYSYVALSGDTFDSISLDFYNEESLSNQIISANPQYRNIILFSGGEVLQIPIIEKQAANTLPPWKRS